MTTIVPFLSVRHGGSAVEFYQRAFGAAELLRIENEKGEIVAHLSVDGGEFWVADESPAHANFSPESLGGGTVRLLMSIEDPDAAFDRAVAAGAKIISPVSNQHGWRVGRLVDPFGHHWEIARPLKKNEEKDDA